MKKMKFKLSKSAQDDEWARAVAYLNFYKTVTKEELSRFVCLNIDEVWDELRQFGYITRYKQNNNSNKIKSNIVKSLEYLSGNREGDSWELVQIIPRDDLNTIEKSNLIVFKDGKYNFKEEGVEFYSKEYANQGKRTFLRL